MRPAMCLYDGVCDGGRCNGEPLPSNKTHHGRKHWIRLANASFLPKNTEMSANKTTNIPPYQVVALFSKRR